MDECRMDDWAWLRGLVEFWGVFRIFGYEDFSSLCFDGQSACG